MAELNVKLFMAVFAAFCITPHAVLAAGCLEVMSTFAEPTFSDTVDTKLENLALTFMKTSELIKEGEEYDFPEIGISAKWKAEKTVTYKGQNLLVMRILITTKGQPDDMSPEFEVLVVTGELKKTKIVRFEDAFNLPEKIVAKIPAGHGNTPEKSYYYAEFTGSSVIDLFKSIYLGIPYYGLMGIVIPGGNAEYDPTPGRKWKIVDVTFNLRRGMTAEGMDIGSQFFDEDFNAYFSGAFKKISSTGVEGASVGPWMSEVPELVKVVE
ncbi:MAG: hypothetical protein A2Z20_03465 [Bdellovibrionales bacterium RBG_16_40_8]|nr:MAG: hypothetical protein A2Z20_03465 [Bdellovibrionales bacterium RBG_16_40_8]